MAGACRQRDVDGGVAVPIGNTAQAVIGRPKDTTEGVPTNVNTKNPMIGFGKIKNAIGQDNSHTGSFKSGHKY